MADGLFPDLKWHHVGVSVENIDKAISFYAEVFGFELEFRKYIGPIETHFAFIRRDGFRMEIFQKSSATPVPDQRQHPNTDLLEQGTKHPCFSVSDCQAALETLYMRHDVEITGIVRKPGAPMSFEDDPRLTENDTREPAAAFFFKDPNNILVEIVRASDFTV